MAQKNSKIDITQLADVIYSAGRVFDGLRTGRVDTGNFLRTGNTDGISSRQDLMLLEDLRSLAQTMVDRIEHQAAVDVDFLKHLNQSITQTGPLHPGQLRSAEQNIGVGTRYGYHRPPALNDESLAVLLEHTIRSDRSTQDNALDLFVQLAKAQPFEDGNKRTALFAANSLLLEKDNPSQALVLTAPIDENDPTLSEQFNDRIARAYIFDEDEAVISMLREHGLRPLLASESALERQKESTQRILDEVAQIQNNSSDTGFQNDH